MFAYFISNIVIFIMFAYFISNIVIHNVCLLYFVDSKAQNRETILEMSNCYVSATWVDLNTQ